MKRCAWVSDDPIYISYHDEEWGRPVHDDRVHFEFLVLESAQAGLSWITILKRREGYKKAFANFDPVAVATFDNSDVQRLLQDTGIIRNRRKIEAAINNAKVFLEIQREFGSFNTYIWQFVDNKPIVHKWSEADEVPATSTLSDQVSNDLKARGMKFIGSTIIYAYLQATGLVFDHTKCCFLYAK